MLPDGAFTVLLLLIGGISAVTVPPPANVTVSCRNAKITVSWDYSKRQPPTSFRVNISGSAGNLGERETREHQFDLSPLVWKSGENYKKFLYVTVTAVQGDGQSEGVQSNKFSFNKLMMVDTKCSFEFPPVEVNVDESGATVSFPHPVYFYKELEQTIKQDAPPKFQYTIKNGTADISHDVCTVKHNTCKRDVQFPEGVKKCVRLKGVLFDSKSIGQLVFNESALICAHDSAKVNVVTITVVLFCIFVVIITVVVVYICKTNAWTMQILSTPKSLDPNSWPAPQTSCPLLTEDISAVSVHKPQKRLSVSSEDSSHSEDDQDSSACSDQRPPAESFYTDSRLLESSSQELEGAELISEGSGSDNDSADDSVKTECVSMGSEEDELESVSLYDCPHTHTDVGHG